MTDDLKLPQVGELTLPRWQYWLARYNEVLSEKSDRIEKLEALVEQSRDDNSSLIDSFDKDFLRQEARIEKLEAALRSVLQYQLTDETWVKLGFDPKTIRAEFDAARKALDAE